MVWTRAVRGSDTGDVKLLVEVATDAGFTTATHAAWWVLAACGAVVLVLGLVATSRWALETARRTAAELNPEVLAGSPAT